MKAKTYAKIIIGSSILGVANAAYLTYIFVQRTFFASTASSFCDVSNRLACSSVVTSKYAQLLGIPICTWALVVYGALIVLAILALKAKKPRNLFYAISIISGMGVILNSVYLNNEWQFLGVFCLLCGICLIFILTNLVSSILGYSKS